LSHLTGKLQRETESITENRIKTLTFYGEAKYTDRKHDLHFVEKLSDS